MIARLEMAVEVRIPEEQQEALARLLSLSREDAATLLTALEGEPPSLSLAILARHVSTKLTIPRKQLTEILLVLAGMYLTCQTNGRSREEFVDAVLTAARRLDQFQSSEIDWDHARGFLIALLRCDRSLGATTKANGVYYEYERTFAKARILTDIRPIFGDNVDEPPNAAVVVHTLRITYATPHGQEEPSAFYVALDASDLKQLQEQITRALTKEQSVSKSLDAIKLQVLSTQEDV
jgi:hypothetical protein